MPLLRYRKQARQARVKPTKGESSAGRSVEKARPGDRVRDAKFLAGATTPDQFPPPTSIEIAFAGRSNVGKSSLLNCLMERKSLVRTSSTPGCTRQVSWFETKADDDAILQLVDLPGYGYAKRSKTERGHWGKLIDDYLMRRVSLKAVVLLIDARRGLEEDDRDLIEMIQTSKGVSRSEVKLLVVATKLDKLSRAEHKPRLLELSRTAGVRIQGFSSVTRAGRDDLWRQLRSIALVSEAQASAPPDEAELP